jgi:hypothetical protein
VARGEPAPCPPCPADPWVVLARVELPPSPSTPVAEANIDNFAPRQLLFSTGALQEQLIECCCGEQPEPEPEADLSIRKEQELDPREGGVPAIRYTVTVENLGPSEAANVVVSDVLSVAGEGVALATFLSFATTHGDGWSVTAQEASSAQLQAEIDHLAPNESAELAFTAVLRVDPDVNFTDLEVINTATVSSETADPVPGNNSDFVTSLALNPNEP